MSENKINIIAAMKTQENDVPIPPSVRTASLISQIAALKVGDTFTRTLAISGDTSVSEVSDTITEMKRGLLNATSSSVRGAVKRLGGAASFSTETGHYLSDNGKVYIMCFVTRDK